MPLCLSQDADADALLDRDPFALLVGMLLDQQFPMERAFAGPALLAQRLGRTELDPRELAAYDPDALVEIFRGPPAVHRYPGSMAGRVQALAAAVVDQYDGDATLIWRDVAGRPRAVRAGSPRCPGSASRRRRSSPRCSASSAG